MPDTPSTLTHPLDSTPPGQRYRAPVRLVGAQAHIERPRSAIILTALSLLISCLVFPPVNWGLLGYVCLVPWLVCICTASNAKLIYLLSWLFGLGYFAFNIAWMYAVTIPGYAALSIYYSLYFPLAAWPIRHMHQRHGVSVALSTAIVWTAVEYLRSIGELAFPWLLLGHTQYKFLSIIQIADLVGVYGVTFLVAMVNGWITDLLIQPILIWRSDQIARLPLGTLSLALLLIGSLTYGWYQSSESSYQPGPKVAVVQHDFPQYVDERAWRTSPDMVFRSYYALGEMAAKERPDVIVFPETVMTGYLNDEFIQATPAQLDEIRQRRFPTWDRNDVLTLQSISRKLRDDFQTLSTSSGIPIVIGCSAMEWKPTALPPRAEGFNSAYLLVPGRDRPVARYDKNHLVLFGEYVPFRYTYHGLYQWLNSLTPWGQQGAEYSLGAGSGFNAFEFEAKSQNGRRYRAGTPICYEEIMPYIGREFARPRPNGPENQKNCDMLFAISNDGWFLHTAELEQHLAGAVFRAVENRISIARSVNTGASCFVHPNGRIVDRVEMAKELRPHLAAVQTALTECAVACAGLCNKPGQMDEEAAFDVTVRKLHTTLQPLGKPFQFMHDRMLNLRAKYESVKRMKRIPEAPPSGNREKSLDVLYGQITDDLDTVQRWQDHPDTAPGYQLSQLPVDGRLTLFARWGDWFSQGSVALSGMMLLDWMLRRIWRKMAAKD
ncbi:MAG: apolipoprotein N-acyltransferase [Planctomycetota bacterium]